jgi:hypothetical protein
LNKALDLADCMKIINTGRVAILFLGVAFSLPAQNLLTDGNFASPYLDGYWNARGHVEQVTDISSSGTSYYVLWNASTETPNGTISQLFGTVPGQEYSLQFYYITESYESGATVPQSLDIEVRGNSILLDTVATAPVVSPGADPPSPSSFEQFNFNFTADSTLSTLEFADDPGNVTVGENGWLQNAQVVPYSAPAQVPDQANTAPLSAFGFLLLACLSKWCPWIRPQPAHLQRRC